MTKYMGIDASTKSIAWGIIEKDQLLSYGEFYFTSSDFDYRLYQARTIMESQFFLDIFNSTDYITFEKAIIGPNREVALKMAQMFGVIKSVLKESTAKLVEAPPMSWQEKIGNPVFRGRARTDFFKQHPEWKTRSQMNNGIRAHRKAVTQKIVYERFGEMIESDNVTDAIGIAVFGEMVLKR